MPEYDPRRIRAKRAYDISGRMHRSVAQAKRANELIMLERAGHIRNLQHEVRYRLSVNGIKIADYYADFTYYTLPDETFVVEDHKSRGTENDRVFPIKRNLVKALYGLDIRVTGGKKHPRSAL